MHKNMKIIQILWLTLLLLLSQTVFTQTNTDSLKHQLNANITDSTKINILKKLATEYSYISTDSAIIFIEQAIIISKNNTNKIEYVKNLLQANKISRLSGNYEDAITYSYLALNVADSINNTNLMAQSAKYLGISYYRIKNFDKALEFHNKALELYIELEDTIYQADCYTNIGVVYDETAEFDSALEYYDKALIIYEAENELSGMADIYNNIAGIYYQKHENDKIIDYMNKSLEIRRQMGDNIGIIYTLINMGGVYGQTGNFQKAVENIQEGIEIAIQADILPLVNVGYEAMYELYLNNENYENAFEYYKLFNETKDSLFSIEKEKNIQELQTKYETEKKNVVIQELKIDNLKAENQKKTFIIIAISLFLITILMLIFIRQRTKLNAILKEKNTQLNKLNATQNRLMSIISHDLKAPLSAFYSITSSLKTKFNKIDRLEIDRYFDRMLNSSIALKLQLENMLNWAINQNREITVNKSSYNLHILTFKVVMILQEFANEKNITIENNIDENFEIITDSRLLSIVLNNLISNAVKFSSNNSKIQLSATVDTDKTTIFVKDFGIGMTKEEAENLFKNRLNITKSDSKETGLGLIVSKDIVEKLGGKIIVTSEPNKGTEFKIEF